TPPSVLRAANIPAPEVLQQANTWLGLLGFLAVAHSLSLPDFWERSLSTAPLSWACTVAGARNSAALKAATPAMRMNRLPFFIGRLLPGRSGRPDAAPGFPGLGLRRGQLAVLLVVSVLAPRQAGPQQLHADLLDADLRVVGEEAAHELVVRGAMVEPHPRVLVQDQAGHEGHSLSVERVSGPRGVDADEADLV